MPYDYCAIEIFGLDLFE